MRIRMTYTSLLLAAALSISGCAEKEPAQEDKAVLEVSASEITAGYEGGEYPFGVKCNKKPYIVGNYDWCTTKTSPISGGALTVTLTVKENGGKEPRKADFSLVCDELKAKVTLVQDGNPSEQPEPENPEDMLAFLETPKDLPSGNVTAIANKLGIGWNMGNQMDAYSNGVSSETAWGQPKCTQQTFDKLKQYGFNSVRVPITWAGHIGPAPDYKVDEAWMNRVAEIVGYCEKAGLNCIINTHHDENHNNQGDYSSAFWLDILSASLSPSFNDMVKAELASLWTQIAERFKDKGDWLIFEPFNEINDGGWGWSASFQANPEQQTSIVNEWNQVFVDAVRATGGNNSNRWLCAIGYCANSDFTMKYLKLPKDPTPGRLMVGVHCYDPYDYCTKASYSEWGHTGLAGRKPAESEKHLVDLMSRLYINYILNGIPCYFGEFGCVNRSDVRSQTFQKYYLEFFCKAARNYHLPCFIWDNGNDGSGERFGFINHGTGEYMSQGATIIPAIVKGRTSGEAGYTLRSVYENAPR